MSDDDDDGGQERLRALHAEVDRRAGTLAGRHGARLRCRRGCPSCCVDDLTVFEVEAERIRRAHPELLAEGVPHPPGACAFLDAEGACRVYEARPYVCRTQGLPLRFFHEDDGGEVREGRVLCPLNLPDGPPLRSLAEDDCWLVGPTEDALRRLQESTDGGRGTRVALRALFGRRGEPPR